MRHSKGKESLTWYFRQVRSILSRKHSLEAWWKLEIPKEGVNDKCTRNATLDLIFEINSPQH